MHSIVYLVWPFMNVSPNDINSGKGIHSMISNRIFIKAIAELFKTTWNYIYYIYYMIHCITLTSHQCYIIYKMADLPPSLRTILLLALSSFNFYSFSFPSYPGLGFSSHQCIKTQRNPANNLTASELIDQLRLYYVMFTK